MGFVDFRVGKAAEQEANTATLEAQDPPYEQMKVFSCCVDETGTIAALTQAWQL